MFDHLLFQEDMENIFHSRNTWDVLDDSVVLITGATGMLASYLSMYFIWLRQKKNKNISIAALFRNEEKARELYGKFWEEDWFYPIKGDISSLDFDGIDILKHVNFVFHAASYASAKYYGVYPVETILPNVIGTNRLLEFYSKRNLRGFLFFSSTAVYGNYDKAEPIVEKQSCNINLSGPGNYYGISKYCGEAICKAYASEHDLKTVAVRIAHSYGPTMDYRNDVRVYAEFVRNVIDRENITIKSAGTDSRIFCYASDCISGMLTALLDGEAGESYNLANPYQEYRIRDLAQAMAELFPERNLKVEFLQRRDENYAPSTYSSNVTINVGKLEKLGWSPKVSVSEGFRRTVLILEGNE